MRYSPNTGVHFGQGMSFQELARGICVFSYLDRYKRDNTKKVGGANHQLRQNNRMAKMKFRTKVANL
jgi:hypothetical protein